MQHIVSTIASSGQVAPGVHRMEFSWPHEAPEPAPGQFLTVRVGSGISPLLRRPFAFAGFDHTQGRASFVYESRGQATRLLSAYEPGDSLDVIGPLGNGFRPFAAGERPMLVAGGIGLGPMLFLHAALRAEGVPAVLVAGARSADRLPASLMPADAVLVSEDGAAGIRGTVLDALGQLAAAGTDGWHLACCGPHGMMKAVAAWAKDRALPCQVSLEQTMACAVGACMGCVVKVHHEKPYSRVCMDGPVYSAESIDWSV